jgi:hypothetical protein
VIIYIIEIGVIFKNLVLQIFFKVYSREGHKTAFSNLSSLLQRHLPEIPIFWAIGNHEAVPVNAFATHFVPERFRPTWMYQAILNEAHKTDKGQLPVEADESFI